MHVNSFYFLGSHTEYFTVAAEDLPLWSNRSKLYPTYLFYNSDFMLHKCY